MNQFSRRTNDFVSVFMTAGLAVLLLVVSAEAQQNHTSAPRPSKRVLFMCPHGAAKSVLAIRVLRRLAKERGLNVEVDSAGTEPDPSVAPAVATRLANRVTLFPPRSLA